MDFIVAVFACLYAGRLLNFSLKKWLNQVIFRFVIKISFFHPSQLHLISFNSSQNFFTGLIPVPVRPPHANNISTTLPTVKMVIDVSKSRAVLTTHNIAKALRSKEALGVVDIKSWPTVVEVDDAPKKKLTNPYRAPTAEMIAYLDFSVSTTGMLSGVKVRAFFVTSLQQQQQQQILWKIGNITNYITFPPANSL